MTDHADVGAPLGARLANLVADWERYGAVWEAQGSHDFAVVYAGCVRELRELLAGVASEAGR